MEYYWCRNGGEGNSGRFWAVILQKWGGGGTLGGDTDSGR